MINWKFWKKQKELLILEEEYKFLKYIYKNSPNKERTEVNNLKKIFGEDEYKRIYNSIGGKYITPWRTLQKDNKKIENICILPPGFKFIEEYERKNKELKYAKLMFISSIILVCVTLSYVVVTGINTGIISSQFESENRPYITIEELSFAYPLERDLKLPGYIMSIENRGQSLTKITSIKIYQSPTKVSSIKEVNEESWIFPQEIILKDFGRIEKASGGFYDMLGTSAFARIRIDYEWNEKPYYTIMDFMNPTDIHLKKNESIQFRRTGQIFDKNPPEEIMYNSLEEGIFIGSENPRGMLIK